MQHGSICSSACTAIFVRREKYLVKKLFAIISALCMILALTACGAPSGAAAAGDSAAASPAAPQETEPQDAVGNDGAGTPAPIAASPAPADAGENSTPDSETDSKILVAYFSCTGTTERIATQVTNLLNADVYRIVPEEPYTDADLNYNDSSSRTSLEMNDSASRPAISGSVENIEDYEIIFIGYPIWWGQAPHIVYTFFESYDFSGKTIVPFCTSGSSGVGSSASNLHGCTSDAAVWLDGTRLSRGISQSDLEAWLGGLELGLLE